MMCVSEWLWPLVYVPKTPIFTSKPCPICSPPQAAVPAPLPWAVPGAVAPGLVQLNRPDPPLNVQDPDTEAAGPSAGWKVTGCAAATARSVATLDPDSRGRLLGTAPVSHVQFLPFCPVLCAGASGSHAIKHPKGQGLGMCNNSEGTPGRGSVT